MQTAAIQLYSAAGTMVAWVGHTRSTQLHAAPQIHLFTYYLHHPLGTRLDVVQHSYLIYYLGAMIIHITWASHPGVRGGGYGPSTFHDWTHPLLDYAIE